MQDVEVLQAASIPIIIIVAIFILPVWIIRIIPSANPVILYLIAAVILWILSGPFICGFSHIFLKVVREQSCHISDAFIGFLRFGRSIRIALRMSELFIGFLAFTIILLTLFCGFSIAYSHGIIHPISWLIMLPSILFAIAAGTLLTLYVGTSFAVFYEKVIDNIPQDPSRSHLGGYK